MAKRSPLDPARQAALNVLRAVRVQGAYANLALATERTALRLSGRDAAFATELASGTLRYQGLYDAIVAQCADRPLSQINAKVRDLLALGVHQLLAMRVADHAALDTTVRAVRHESGPGAAGFANAVLRAVQAHDRATWTAKVTQGLSPTEALATAYSHPTWIVESLAEALGARVDELPALLEADNAPATVTLVARPGLCAPEELPGQPGRWSPYAVELASGDPSDLAAVREGRAGVQDEGSQLVALALAAAPLEGTDVAWLDLCAGPGGKAALLAALAAARGATLIAVEPSAHRAELVRHVVPDTVEVRVADGRAAGVAPSSRDRVLVDAPCTGVGALRRRPEARWRKSLTDVAELTALQRELVGAAITMTRPGGVIAYATCSPLSAETSAIVQWALDHHPVTLIDSAQALPQVTDAVGPLPGTLQLWPHRHGTDAMFVALLRREP